MKISSSQIKKVAGLAKLNLSEAELKQMQADFNEILGYVDNLNKVNTKKVKATSQVTGLKNVKRQDKVNFNYPREDLLNCAPDTGNNLIRVKKIFI
ncbi:MAG: Asp-tRNA(Asn)/Glu-tRNA(Gln) amidotransferase subunit GatC [Patescibacteria group bacterium]